LDIAITLNKITVKLMRTDTRISPSNKEICTKQTYYHVTVLSNLFPAYNRYQRRYSKENLPRSTFKNQFFLLKENELSIGYKKAQSFLERLGLPENRLLILSTPINPEELKPNHRNGLGYYVSRNWIDVDSLYFVGEDERLEPISLEDAMALSIRCTHSDLRSYPSLTPRTVSVLPVARGCQAKCPFCFSAASVSKDQVNGQLDPGYVDQVFQKAKDRGAERAVITGGGEPGVLNQSSLLDLIRIASKHFKKVVLITNGFHLGTLSPNRRLEALKKLRNAGLTVLAISRHHHENCQNSRIMHLETLSEEVAETWNFHRTDLTGLKMRWICVLQKGGIENQSSLRQYLDWAEQSGVNEVCFKELYVSTSNESEYYTEGANQWCRDHQVPLKLILDESETWEKLSELPWGAPIFQIPNKRLKVAAYTEPSLFWERTHGICRSWNLMADGRCLASLEDQTSVVL